MHATLTRFLKLRICAQNPDSAFPYYVFRIGADLGINKALTWNVVSFRYRDALSRGTLQHAAACYRYHLQARRAAIGLVEAPAQLARWLSKQYRRVAWIPTTILTVAVVLLAEPRLRRTNSIKL